MLVTANTAKIQYLKILNRIGDKKVTAKLAKPQITTEMAAPLALAAEGYISVGISLGCGSHPMPNAAVAIYSTITPGIASGRVGR